MRPSPWFILPLLLLFGVPLIGFSAEFGLTREGRLDQVALTKAYQESEWEQVTKSLEGYLRKKGDSKVAVDERLFAYKYLGVIYAADSLSRSKAESYFTRLLKLSSDIEIVDLYASKRVNDLFAEVKNEHLKRQAYEQRLANQGASPVTQPSSVKMGEPAQERAPQKIPPKSETRIEDKSSRWMWWTVGIAAAAGVGAGAYYLTQNDDSKKIETRVVTPPEQ